MKVYFNLICLRNRSLPCKIVLTYRVMIFLAEMYRKFICGVIVLTHEVVYFIDYFLNFKYIEN